MKKCCPYLVAFVFCISISYAQNNVGINTTTPDASAALDVNSTSQGVLVPRMTLAQRDAINSPATGLIIYQTDNTPGFYFNAGTPAEKNWTSLTGGTSSGGSNANVFGDGSAGSLNITSNTDWSTSAPANLNFQFSSITIASGATLTVPSGTKLRSSGDVSIAGSINVSGTERNIGISTSGWNSGIARSYPGTGDYIAYGILPASVLSLVNIPSYGGGAGANGGVGSLSYAGEGGGSFAIYGGGTISIAATGSINANGGNAFTGVGSSVTSSNGCGGGAGGVVVLLSKAGISNNGSVRANGGAGSDALAGTSSRPGGGGGGGGVALLLGPSITAGTVEVNGGAAGNNLVTTGISGSRGGAGGASGGNGGAGSIASSSTGISLPAAGSAGIFRSITTSNPENLY